jgi:soluble epoxide hydrolase/lipid-phosphate phosphatase
MAHIAFPQQAKTLTLSTSRTYSYVYIPSTNTTSGSPPPSVLFLHGFPSSCYDWRHQITSFSRKGYNVLAPDLLGYGGTDKPSSPEEYRAKQMSAEIIEILDHENLPAVHAVGHDTGCGLLSRLANYFPSRLLTCSFLTVPYSKPGETFDLNVVNRMCLQFMGFERFGYIGFFVKDGAGGIVDEHVSYIYTGPRNAQTQAELSRN